MVTVMVDVADVEGEEEEEEVGVGAWAAGDRIIIRYEGRKGSHKCVNALSKLGNYLFVQFVLFALFLFPFLFWVG